MVSFSIGEEAYVLLGKDLSPRTSAALPYEFWRTHVFWRKKGAGDASFVLPADSQIFLHLFSTHPAQVKFVTSSLLWFPLPQQESFAQVLSESYVARLLPSQ